MSQSNSVTDKVAVVKGETPQKCVLEGLKNLGGISEYVSKGDQVFIKINLTLPHGFPTNTNFDVLATVIQECNNVGAKKVYVGSFPFNGMTIKAISDILKLDKYIKSLGAELIYLDNSNYFKMKGFKELELKNLKERSFSNLEIEGRTIQYPKIIENSDKLVIINQVNVEPLFKCQLSLQNLFSLVQDKLHENKENSFDHYINEFISTVFGLYSIKKPDLIINDLFYLLEGAGPYIYSDSKLKKTNFMVLGNDIGSVDMSTLKLLKLDLLKNKLYEEAIQRKICPSDLSEFNLIGENIEDNAIDIDLCCSKLEDIKVRGMIVKSGKTCPGCYKQAYHLFNLMKTNMIKDLKYLTKNSFLIGEDPPEPDHFDKETGNPLGNILIFGDCAINSTEDIYFRKITAIKVKKTTIEKVQSKIQKLQLKKIRETNNKKLQKLDLKIKNRSAYLERLKNLPEKPREKVKEKSNKNILELPGCPPDLFTCVELILKYYGKKEVPTLNLFYKTLKSYIYRNLKKKLEIWEAL